MQITEADIQNTLLELFARKGLAHGDQMWLSRLEHFWNDTRLRRGDLVYGIAQLCTAGLLDMEEHGNETCLSLTESGEAKAQALQASGVNYCGRYLREELLPSVRLRADPPRADGVDRRERDRAAPRTADPFIPDPRSR